MQMLNENCLILPEDMTGKQESGLIIMENIHEFETGVVILAGPGEQMKNGKIRPNACKVGDRVMFRKYEGTAMEYRGKEHFIMPDDHIFCTLS